MGLPKTGKDLYKKVQPPAEAIKGYIQIGIGITVIAIFAQQWISLRHEQFSIVSHALTLVGYGLAVSAAVELAYTFFTKGPDEALDPLILGVSSFALISLSKIDPPVLTINDAIPVSLFALALLLLFFARRFLLQVEQEELDAGPSEARRSILLGEAVRERRIALGLSQAELATRAGIAKQTLARVETASTVPTIPILGLISVALQADLIIEFAPYKTQ